MRCAGIRRRLHVFGVRRRTRGRAAHGRARVEPNRSAWISYLALANALELTIELDAHWSLSLAFHAFVPLQRINFVVRDESGTVVNSHEVAAAGGVVSLGPSCRF